MRTLVTGGAGFLGSHLFTNLLKEDDVRLVHESRPSPFRIRDI